MTTVSPTLQTQSQMTRRFSAMISRTVQLAVTRSPIRTGALKRMVALMKIEPAPGSLVPSTVEINDYQFAQAAAGLKFYKARAFLPQI